MTAKALRLLADSLERDFMTAEDRKGWVSDLRGFAKSIERREEDAREEFGYSRLGLSYSRPDAIKRREK